MTLRSETRWKEKRNGRPYTSSGADAGCLFESNTGKINTMKSPKRLPSMDFKNTKSRLPPPPGRISGAMLVFGLVLPVCGTKNNTQIDPLTAICAEGYIDTETTSVPTLVLSIEAYCQYYDCPKSIDQFESGWETCEQEEHDYSNCGYYRHVGCGEHIYEEFSDESWYGWVLFDSETNALLGLGMGSDSNVFCEQKAGAILVGERHSYWECKDLQAIETTRCCSYGSINEQHTLTAIKAIQDNSPYP
jgi:hypothetical protein